MRVNNFNQDVRLLEIARNGAIQQQNNLSNSNRTFKETFSQELASTSDINFSKHAQQRLYSRGIEMSDDKLTQLSQAIDKAAMKGSKDTLILDDNAAYVVSVPNRTVVTAFDRSNLQEGVFTSIDSAVIL